MTITDPFDVGAADAQSPGCAGHGKPDCLCDVDLSGGLARPEQVPASMRDIDTVEDFVTWAARIATIMELGLNFDLACYAREKYEDAATPWQVQQAIRSSVEAGLTLAQTCKFWSVDITLLMRRWSTSITENGERWLEAERLMRDTLIPYAEIGRMVGLTRHQVKNLSELLERNGRSPRRNYLDMLQAEARALQATGTPAHAIARKLTQRHGEPIGKARVQGWLRSDRQ